MDALSDKQILDLVEKAPRIQTRVLQLTPSTVAKVSQDIETNADDAPEANVLNLVFEKTKIPVPRVRRVVKQHHYFLIVVDYVKGRTLADVWSTFSVWKKIRVAFTLRRYVRQLRRLQASPMTPPGPLSAQGPRICESPIFGQVQSHRGPFASYAELSAFFAQRCKMGLNATKVPHDHPWREERFDDSSPLVLTHQDINPRNVIEGEDGRLWLIDYAWSGYYPPWFEYVAMHRQVEVERDLGFKDKFWEAMVPFVCGPYFKQERWLDRMGVGLDYA